MPVINIPIKEWGADMAEQAKRKAQAAMQEVQDTGGAAIEEAQRKAQAARDEWLKQQIDQAMAPIREAGHSAAEGLGALAQNAGENLQQNVEAVQQAPAAQAIGEKASGLGTFAQGVRQDLRKGADAAVAADTALDTALSERDAADRAAPPTIPEEVSAPPSFQVPGALPAMTADTLPNPVEFPTNVAKNYLGSLGQSAEDLTSPDEWGKTAAAAKEIAPEVVSPVQTAARLASDQTARDTFMEKDLPAAGQVLKTVGDVGNVVPLPGEQLENLAASATMEATKDTGMPEPVRAGLSILAGTGLPTAVAKRAFRAPGSLSSRLDEAGRAAMGDGRLSVSDGTPPVGDVPEPERFPPFHTDPGMRRAQPGPGPDSDPDRARIPSFDREAFPGRAGGPALPPSDAPVEEGSLPFTPPRRGLNPPGGFPDPHARGERGLGELDMRRVDEPYWDNALENTFTPEELDEINLAIQNGEIGDTDEPTNRQVLGWVQENFNRRRGPGETPDAGRPIEQWRGDQPGATDDFIPDSARVDPTEGMTQAEKDEYWYGGSDFPGQEQSPLMQAFEATGRERRRIAREQGLEVDWLPNDELGRLGEDDFQRMLRDRTHRPFVDDRFTPRGEPTEPPSGMSQVPGETGRLTGMERLPRGPRPEPGPSLRDQRLADNLDAYEGLSPAEQQVIEDAWASGELTREATVGEAFDLIDRRFADPLADMTVNDALDAAGDLIDEGVSRPNAYRAAASNLGTNLNEYDDADLAGMQWGEIEDTLNRKLGRGKYGPEGADDLFGNQRPISDTDPWVTGEGAETIDRLPSGGTPPGEENVNLPPSSAQEMAEGRRWWLRRFGLDDMADNLSDEELAGMDPDRWSEIYEDGIRRTRPPEPVEPGHRIPDDGEGPGPLPGAPDLEIDDVSRLLDQQARDRGEPPPTLPYTKFEGPRLPRPEGPLPPGRGLDDTNSSRLGPDEPYDREGMQNILGRTGSLADQIAGRTAGAIQGGVAADRMDEEDTGFERAGRIATGAALGAAAKPANVRLGTFGRALLRGAGRLDADEAGVLGATDGGGTPPRGPGRPRRYSEADRTPPSRPPKDYSGDLLLPTDYPQGMVAEEALQVARMAGDLANEMRATARKFPEGTPRRAEAEAAALALQQDYIAAVKARMTPAELQRYNVEYALQRQGRARPPSQAEGIRAANSGADALPETPPSSRVDEPTTPTTATTGTGGPGEPGGARRTPAPRTRTASEAAADVTDEGVTVTETPEEAAARRRVRERALAEQEGATPEGGTAPDEGPVTRQPQRDMGRAEQQSRQPLPLTEEEAEAEAVANAQRAAEARARGETVEEVGPTGQALEGEAPQRRAPQKDMTRIEEESTRPLPEDEGADVPPPGRGAEPGEVGRTTEAPPARARVTSGSADERARQAAARRRARRPEARAETPVVTDKDVTAPPPAPDADKAPHLGDWLEAVRYGVGLLANPVTAGADALAGAAEIPWTRMRNRLLDATDADAKFVRAAERRGYKAGGAAGRRNAREIMSTGKELRELLPGAAAEDTPQSLMRRYRERGQEGWARAAGAVEFASRGRNALDALSHGSLYTGQLYREAAQAVNKTSLPKGSDQWWEAVEDFVDKAESPDLAKDTPEFKARTKALEQADRALGRNDPGYIGTHVANALKNPVLRPFIPLFRTGYNISMRGLERSPLGAGAILFDKALGREVTPERIMDTAMGSSVTLPLAAYAVASGNITGYGPNDQKTRDDLMAQGWRPFSIRTPDGRYRSYLRFGATAAPLAMAGAIGDASRYHEPDEPVAQRMAHAGGNFGQWFGNQFLLRSLGNISDLFTDPGKELPGFAGRTIGQYVGVGSGTGALASAADPYLRDTEVGGVNPFVNEMLKNIPVARQSLEPEYDVTGAPKPNPGYGLGGFLNPYTAGPSEDEVNPVALDERRYRGSESAAEDARIAAAIAAYEKYQSREDPREPGPETEDLYRRFAGRENERYTSAREKARAAEAERERLRLVG